MTRPGEARAWLDAYLANVRFANECVVWPFAKVSDGHNSAGGYPSLNLNKRRRLVHRLVYAHVSGRTLTRDIIIRHKCDNPPCINPQHLIPGTHAANVRDKVERGRQAKGERNGRAKLTAQDVREIRQLVAEHGRRGNVGDIARGYGLDPKAIRDMLDRVTWRDVA